MTRALDVAFRAAAALPADEQDSLAAAILAEIEAEKRWDDALAASEPMLERLADEALDDRRAGRTEPLDPVTSRTTPR